MYVSVHTTSQFSVYNCQYAGLERGRSLMFEPLMFKAIARAVEPVPRHQVQLAKGTQLWFSELSVYVNFPVNNSVSATLQHNMLCILRQMLQTAFHCGQFRLLHELLLSLEFLLQQQQVFCCTLYSSVW
jgi:hypothetical protein